MIGYVSITDDKSEQLKEKLDKKEQYILSLRESYDLLLGELDNSLKPFIVKHEGTCWETDFAMQKIRRKIEEIRNGRKANEMAVHSVNESERLNRKVNAPNIL